MFKQTMRLVLAAVLAVSMLVGWNGIAQAYLPPIGPGDTPDYLTTPNWANSPPMHKFIDTLPELNAPNNLGQSLPIAVADTTTYPGSDYYIIKLVEFSQQMHTDLPPTKLRGYVQMVGNGTPPTDPNYIAGLTQVAVGPQYLGPIIVAQKDRPVRVLFINGLPTGAGGDLFVPTDETIMGSGDYEIDYNPDTKDAAPLTNGKFTQNRGELHLHGGRTPWISDGTPHQWITPAGDADASAYAKGVSTTNVSDMPDPGPGAQTYYWTNQQSARLMFYHDHAWGITRLNVYVGEAAGYLIQDPTETALVNAGVLPSEQIPLVIQDKTFVDANPANPTYVLKTDPTWRWGSGAEIGTISEFGDTVPVHAPNTGDLWWPHVYMPAQNPFDITGIAPMGRWAYGPYFWPATNNPYQPIPNPYFNENCDAYFDADLNGTFDQRDIDLNKAAVLGYTTIPIPGAVVDLVTFVPHETPYCQPMEIPSTPNPSWGAEAFMDTPTVNGTAYPVLNVEPKAYRLRILNAAHDRFFNLSMFIAADKNSPTTEDVNGVGTVLCDNTFAGNSADCTEVKMLPAAVAVGMPATWPADGRPGGFPDWTTAGPSWLQIGTEGGFLPQPVTLPPHPVTWNNDVTTFNAGNVNGGSLILGPAERADVIVDFADFAGQTLILYNDAPAPWPALDPHYDYFTGAPDMTEAGGAPPTLPGMGPNTRTIMQIVVGTSAGTETATGAAFDPVKLAQAFAGTLAGTIFANGNTVFENGQDPLIVGQGNMNPTADPAHYEAFLFDQDYSAIGKTYGRSFPTTYPNWGVARINDKSIHFYNVDGTQPYKYNSADLTTHPLDNTIRLYGGLPLMFKAIQDEQGETFDDYGRMRAALGLEMLTPGAQRVNFIMQTYSDPSTEILNENGIQTWKITHNGVDTHPVHFHLYDVQILNRVGWDGFIRLPDPNELGWKDTIRISPLEDTVIALKPITPKLTFGVPESYRPLNPARPLGDQTELTQVDPYTGNARSNLNRMQNLDWEYVWHCHILSHEENDMMRNQSLLVAETRPDPPSSLAVSGSTTGQIILTWVDRTTAANPDTLGNPRNEIGFYVERRTGSTGAYAVIASVPANTTRYVDRSVAPATQYTYRVAAYNAAGLSTYSNTVSRTTSSGYSIMVTTGTGGSISPAGPFVAVSNGGSQAFTITPSTGYHIADVLVDNVSVGAVPTYTFTNVTANHSILATFALNVVQYAITPSVAGGGAVTPATAVQVSSGGTQAFTFTANAGNIISGVTVDGTPLAGPFASPYTYTFTNVTAAHTIGASFAAAPVTTFTITPSVTGSGTSSPAAAVQVASGGTQAFIFTANAGNIISDITVDGAPLVGPFASPFTYTFTNVTAAHAIAATFIPVPVTTFTITPSVAGSGTSNPATAVQVPSGSNQSFVFTANAGNMISGITVDGTPLAGPFASPYTYTFTNVTAAHTISGTFTPVYTITPSVTGNGTSNPATAVQVASGTDQAFTFTANAGNIISGITVDGTPLAGPFASPYTYTFTNVTTAHTISGTFTPVYTITPSVTGNGTSNPAAAVQVVSGGTQAFTFTANAGNYISAITVDGTPLVGPFASPYTYTFTNVTAAHTINVTFALNPVVTYAIAPAVEGPGTVTPSAVVQVPSGTNQSFVFTPNAGRSLRRVFVDGVLVPTPYGNPYTYTFTNVTAQHEIKGIFQ